MSKIDWREAKKYYMSNETVNYEKVAQAFGVSHIAVRIRGSIENWWHLRKQVIKKADQKILEKLPDLIAKQQLERVSDEKE